MRCEDGVTRHPSCFSTLLLTSCGSFPCAPLYFPTFLLITNIKQYLFSETFLYKRSMGLGTYLTDLSGNIFFQTTVP